MEYFIVTQMNTIKATWKKCDVEQRKPCTKEYIMYNSIYIR